MFYHSFIDHHMLLTLGQYFFCRGDQTIQHKKYDHGKYKSNKHFDTPFPGKTADDLNFMSPGWYLEMIGFGLTFVKSWFSILLTQPARLILGPETGLPLQDSFPFEFYCQSPR